MRGILSNYVLQVHKVRSEEVVHNFLSVSWFLCHVTTWTSHVATSFFILSITPRRAFSRRDVKITCFCHVATCIFTSRRQLVHASVTSRRDLVHTSVTPRRVFSRRGVNLYQPLSRRDVASNVATSFSEALCHVATLTRTSRRWLVYSLSHRDVTPHVATWPCFKPKVGSFWPFTSHTLTHRNPNSPVSEPSPDLSELPSHRSETLHCSPTTSVPL